MCCRKKLIGINNKKLLEGNNEHVKIIFRVPAKPSR
jgi:hypothetical protein